MTHLTKIGERLLAGVMFHNEMTDLFHFIGLKNFYKWQKCQMDEELKHLEKFKCYVLKYHHRLLNLSQAQQPEKLIPSDWYDRSALEITQGDIVNILIAAMDHYVDWERQTKTLLYQEYAELETMSEKKEVCGLIEDVECELAKVEALRQKLQIVNFDAVYVQTLFDK